MTTRHLTDWSQYDARPVPTIDSTADVPPQTETEPTSTGAVRAELGPPYALSAYIAARFRTLGH